MSSSGAPPELKAVRRLKGHGAGVSSIQWSPPSWRPLLIASCSADETVRFWRFANRSWNPEIVLQGSDGKPSCVWKGWGPGESYLLTVCPYGSIAKWQWMSQSNSFNCSFEIDFVDSEVNNMSLSPSGLYLAVSHQESEHEANLDNGFSIWNVSTADTMNNFEFFKCQQDVNMVKWHPKKDILVSVSSDKTIMVWRVDTDNSLTCRQILDETSCGHTSTIRALSFNSEGDRMATSSDDLTLKIWDTPATPDRSWVHLYTLSGCHDRTIFTIDWSRTGIIAGGAADGAICLFCKIEDSSVAAASYKLLLKMNNAHSMAVNSVQWCPRVKHPYSSSLVFQYTLACLYFGGQTLRAKSNSPIL